MTETPDSRPFSDYSVTQGAAEEVVGQIIEQLLTDGGTMLWMKYLERKAFPFAARAVNEAVVSQLRMCFVAHDEGEGEELGDDWQLEDEPTAFAIDSWARSHVPVKRSVAGEDGLLPGTSGSSKATSDSKRRQQMLRNRTSGGGKLNKNKVSKEAEQQQRSTELTREVVLDEEEERFRDLKTQEEAKRREKERRDRDKKREAEEERRKVEALHEQMKKNPHTFDSEGKILWIEEFHADRLAPVQQSSQFKIMKDRNLGDSVTDKLGSSTMSRDMSGTGGKNARSMRQSRRRGHGAMDRSSRIEKEPEFADSFSKLQHGQPPILETIQMSAGVVISSNGKTKEGHSQLGDRHMSRKEYLQLAANEVAGGSHGAYSPTGNDSGHGSGAALGEGAAEGSMGELGQLTGGAATKAALLAASQEAASGSSGNGALPALGGGARGISGGADRNDVQKAPRAAPPKTRTPARKFESLGFIRPPRYHTPSLGGPYGFGSAQPPLGATMGHGLVRHGSLKEAFFFPPAIPDMPVMLRSISETALGSARREKYSPSKPSSSMGDGSPAGPLSDGESEDHGGRMKPELSPAYRNFRLALSPEGGQGRSPGATGGSFGARGGSR